MRNDDLERLRAVDRADVYKAGRRAATLARTRGGIEFRYVEEWVEAVGPPVATTLSVGPEPVVVPGGALPAYFAGLLPEGQRLGVLRRAVKTSAADELSLVLAVGVDAIGDVQVVPGGVVPAEVPPRVVVEDIGQMSYAALQGSWGRSRRGWRCRGCRTRPAQRPPNGRGSGGFSNSTRSASTRIWWRTRRSSCAPPACQG